MTDPDERLRTALFERYRIEQEIGLGGMATVYLAEDLRHHRKVALKVLKPELAAVVGAERFLAEIETTANLQHPHILPLFDSGEADGFLFYVMPYVEGESLRDRLDCDKQLPVDEAVRIATAVANALQAAHDKGVIHRDIKPANVLLSRGEPLVADFGIALAVGAAGGGRLTETGLSLGTPHYMSPEQATGEQTLRPATDIYALGCVLYEMLVGEPPYTGSTAQVILGKIITGEPVSATTARSAVPANVDAAIRRALERLPADRFTGAQDFAKALADPGFRHGERSGAGVGVGAGPWKKLTGVMTGVAALFALAFGWALLPSEPRPLVRFEVTLGEGRPSMDARGLELALSPDGSRIVYVGGAPDGGTQLWQRALDELEPEPVPGTDGALAPVLSPDGMLVAFEDAGGIKTVPLRGGPPFTVVSAGSQPSWGSDGWLYFASVDRVIHRVPATGGESEAVTSPMDGLQRYPSALPDEGGLLLSVTRGGPNQSRIAVVGPEGGEVREILTGTMARYAASGHIVYATADGTLMGAPFDVKRLEVTGPSLGLVAGVHVKISSASQFALSQTGTLLYKTLSGLQSELVWVNRTGGFEPVDPTWMGNFWYPALSPDGMRLAVMNPGSGPGPWDLWVKQLDRGPSLKVTFEGNQNGYPTWTPDGRSVTFFSDRAGGTDLWTRRADRSEPAVLELSRERSLVEAIWSPDDQWLIYRTDAGDVGAGDILALRPGHDTVPVPLAATEFWETSPTLSPDGRWMAYTSDETGRSEIYVVPFPNADDGKWAISTSGGTEPVWSHGSRELFYRSGRGDLVAAEVETEPTLSARQSEVLFPATEFLSDSYHPQYDVSPDDQRFIMIRQVGGDAARKLIVVQNFFEELKRLVPN